MWNIRPAYIEESAAIARLVNSAYRGESSRRGWTTEADLLGGQRTDAEAIAEILSSSSRILVVAEGAGGQLAGCVLLERHSDGAAYLGMLTVDPVIQAQGLGKTLVKWSEEYVRREWGASAVEMTVIGRRTELIAWYERRGYVCTGERRPFPTVDPRFGLPRVPDLEFEVLRKNLCSGS